MTDLIRRRMMMARGSTLNAWDGKFCLALSSSGDRLYSVDYGATWAIHSTSAPETSEDRVAISDCVGYVLTNRAYNVVSTLFSAYSQSNSSTDLKVSGKTITRKSPYYSACASTCSEARWRSSGPLASYIYGVKVSGPVQGEYTVQFWTHKGSNSSSYALSTSDQPTALSASACSADGKYAIIGVSNAFYTNNFGEAWAECLDSQSYGTGVQDVAISGDGQYSMMCTSTGWGFSSNYLVSWTFGNVSTPWRTCAISGDGRTRFVSTGDTQFLRSNMTSWDSPGITNTTAKIWRVRCNWYGTKLLGYNDSNQMVYSTDGGYTWLTSSLDGDPIEVSDIAMSRVPNSNVPDWLLELS